MPLATSTGTDDTGVLRSQTATPLTPSRLGEDGGGEILHTRCTWQCGLRRAVPIDRPLVGASQHRVGVSNFYVESDFSRLTISCGYETTDSSRYMPEGQAGDGREDGKHFLNSDSLHPS